VPKYYRNLTDQSELRTRAGTGLVVPEEFFPLSAAIIHRVSFLQGQVQKAIILGCGSDYSLAKGILKKFPNPKARFEKLNFLPSEEGDKTVKIIFSFSYEIFLPLYDLRNSLAHEIWLSSDEFKDRLLLSSLEEERRLGLVGEKLLSEQENSVRVVYESMVRYIGKIKIITLSDLRLAIKDIELCEWILLHLQGIIGEKDPGKREEALKAFKVFRGTAHIFEANSGLPKSFGFERRRSKKISD
jgi:hypothetical protein